MPIEQQTTELQKIPNAQLIERARKWISDLCESGGKAWSLRVPPDLLNDPDLIFSEICRRLEMQWISIDEKEPAFDAQIFTLDSDGFVLPDVLKSKIQSAEGVVLCFRSKHPGYSTAVERKIVAWMPVPTLSDNTHTIPL